MKKNSVKKLKKEDKIYTNLMHGTGYKPAPAKLVVFSPDEDFFNSITMEDVRDRLHKVVDKLYAK
jgi:hypothetical protein